MKNPLRSKADKEGGKSRKLPSTNFKYDSALFLHFSQNGYIFFTKSSLHKQVLRNIFTNNQEIP
jgi:hypothetical protein